jgi:hypothetical protein
MNRTTTRTDLKMVNSGAWAKIGSRHYRHHTGIEITYNHNRFIWEISNGDAYKTLDIARYEAEKAAR